MKRMVARDENSLVSQVVGFPSRSLKTLLKAHSMYVHIIHPAHPLRGQSFPITQHQRNDNPHLIEIQLADFVQDLPKVWHAESTSWTERKDLLQLPVADVTLTRQEADILSKSAGTLTNWIPTLFPSPAGERHLCRKLLSSVSARSVKHVLTTRLPRSLARTASKHPGASLSLSNECLAFGVAMESANDYHSNQLEDFKGAL